MKVAFCTPSLSGPTKPYIKALQNSIPLIKEAGWEECYVQEVGCPYISAARATMTRKAIDAGADIFVYLDYDLSWRPEDLLTLIETEGDCVAGTYRYKKEEEEYMGAINTHTNDIAILRDDGCISAHSVPAGFLKLTKDAIRQFMVAYPELLYGYPDCYTVDLFNHGAHLGTWYGEDMAFSRRWRACGGKIWVIPDLFLNHHSPDVVYRGNFHEYLMRQPGGSKEGDQALYKHTVSFEQWKAENEEMGCTMYNDKYFGVG